MNQERLIMNNGPRPPIQHPFPNQKPPSIVNEMQQEYCEVPRNDPGFIMHRRSSAGPIPFGAYNNETLINDQPMIGRHNTIGNCNFLSANEFTNIHEHSQEHSAEMTEPKQTYECDACGKRLCSVRSLKRHKNTCKKVKAEQKTGPEATNKSLNNESNTKNVLNKSSKSKNVQIVSTLTELKEESNANNTKNYQQQYYQTSSNKIDQFNNAPQISIENKTNSGIHFIEKNSGKLKNIREDDKVSNIVDSVVAKIRSQSNFSKLSITNQSNIQSSSYQSIPPPQPKQTEHFETISAVTPMNPPKFIAYNNDGGGGTLKQFQPPPKSAPAITTAASTQQFWPVMGTRLIQPPQPVTMNEANTALPIQPKFESPQQISKCDYSYSMTQQYPPVATVVDDPMNYNNNKQQMPTATIQPPQQSNQKSANDDKMEVAKSTTNESNTKPAASSAKIVYRYLCPECDKPYSCRKNVKRHRISQHKVPQQEAQDGFIKRIILPPEAQQQNVQKKNKIESLGTETKIEQQIVEQPQKREQMQTIPTKNEPTFQQPQQYSSNLEQQSVVNNNAAIYQQTPRGPPYSAPLPAQPQQPYFTYPGQYGGGNANRQYCNYSSQIEQQQSQPDNPPHPQQYYCPQQQQQYPQQQQAYYNLPPPHQSQIQSSQMQIPPYNNYPQQREIQPNNQQSYSMMNSGGGQNVFYGGSSHQIQQPQQQQPSTSTNFYANYPQHSQQNPHQQMLPNQYRPNDNVIYSRGPSLEQGNNSSSAGGNYSDSFEYWEQIKSMDLVETTSDSDAIEMAKILEDLKRTEEVTEKRTQELNISSADTTNSGIAGIQRKAVELAEADTTFSPPQQADESGGMQNSQQQIFSQFMPLNHQIPPESPFVMPSQTMFHFNVKTELKQESGINLQQKDNQIIGESSSNDPPKTANKKGKKNKDNSNVGTRKKKNAKGTQIDENTRKRKKPEELSNVDPDSTMNENPPVEADQSNILSIPAAALGIYQTNYSSMFNTTNVGGSIFQR